MRFCEQRVVKERDVRVANEDLGVCCYERIIEIGKKLVGKLATDCADDSFDRGVGEGVVDFSASLESGGPDRVGW